MQEHGTTNNDICAYPLYN